MNEYSWINGYRWMDGGMGGWMDGCVDGWMEGHTRVDGWICGWMDGFVKGRIDVWMDQKYLVGR